MGQYDIKTWAAYRRFCNMLLAGKIPISEGATFPLICISLGVNPFRLDAILLSELGLSGREILRRFLLLLQI